MCQSHGLTNGYFSARLPPKSIIDWPVSAGGASGKILHFRRSVCRNYIDFSAKIRSLASFLLIILVETQRMRQTHGLTNGCFSPRLLRKSTIDWLASAGGAGGNFHFRRCICRYYTDFSPEINSLAKLLLPFYVERKTMHQSHGLTNGYFSACFHP